MSSKVAALADGLSCRFRLGRLLRNQRIDVETALEGRKTPFVRTSVLLSGDTTTQICARRCPSADGCACGLTGDTARWHSVLPSHQRDLDRHALSAFRQMRRLSRGLKLWTPALAGAAVLTNGSLQGDLATAASWAIATTVGLSVVARIGLRQAQRWLFNRALLRGLLPTAPSTQPRPH